LGQSADTGPANGLLHLGMMSVFLFGALANHTEFALVFVLAGALVAASAIFFIPGGSPSKRTVAKASTG
jgi:hypothetical protein